MAWDRDHGNGNSERESGGDSVSGTEWVLAVTADLIPPLTPHLLLKIRSLLKVYRDL